MYNIIGAILFINLNFCFILLYFCVYDQHIHEESGQNCFCIYERLIKSSVGLSIRLKAFHMANNILRSLLLQV